ncbi:hypothetical protein ID866_3408 [Astraeus odoratus]|nr:hypothetical protein ID866_3408 [Astraeus odoratus]
MFAGGVAIDVAAVVAQAGPIPWLGAALTVFTALRDMIRKFSANKTIKTIAARMEQWQTKSKFDLFIRQDELEADISDCHAEIDDCLTRLQINAALDTRNWKDELRSDMKMDRDKILEYLSDIKSKLDIIGYCVQQNHADVQKLMGLMQQLLLVAGENSRGLQTNLYDLQISSGTMLVDMNLKNGEVRLIGEPISGTPTVNIWEGIYLNKQKVAVTMLRAIATNNPKYLQRFNREADIWRRVWEIDQGRHILPFYGFFQNDGPYPYIVSPWMQNGSVDDYVKLHPSVDHRALIKHIAEGINILHTMMPPVVHGGIRGANIRVDKYGKPLLADFGLARILEDITGVSVGMTADAGSLDSQRWAASELYDGGKLTTKADLMSHEKPWPNCNASSVIAKVAKGKKPPRPSDSATISRGLDDRLPSPPLRSYGWTVAPTIIGEGGVRKMKGSDDDEQIRSLLNRWGQPDTTASSTLEHIHIDPWRKTIATQQLLQRLPGLEDVRDAFRLLRPSL